MGERPLIEFVDKFLLEGVALGALRWDFSRTPVALGLAGLAVVACLVLYPRQVRGRVERWRWGLPVLRGLGILGLALATLKPVVVRPRTAAEEGIVLFLVDRSRSMSAQDASGDPAQLVAVADALGRLPAGSRAKSVTALAQVVERLALQAEEAVRLKNELDIARISGRDARGAVERLETRWAELTAGAREAHEMSAKLGAMSTKELDQLLRVAERTKANPDAQRASRIIESVREKTARSQVGFDAELYRNNEEVRAACAALAGKSRLGLAQVLLADPRGGLLAALEKRGVRSQVYGFGGSGIEPLAVGELAADGAATDIDSAAREALLLNTGKRVDAVVVLSDGRQTRARSAAGRTGSQGAAVPVFAVAMAPAGVRDLAVDRVVAPNTALLGDTITVRVEPRTLGLEAKDLVGEVTVSVGGEILAPQALRAKEKGLEPLEFVAKVSEPGAVLVRVVLPTQPGELSLENNVAERWVKVVPGRLRVGLVGGSAAWDYRNLRTLLGETPWAETVELDAAALTAEKIGQLDVVILYDAAAGMLEGERAVALRRLVEEKGGGVIMVAGEVHSPGEYEASAELEFLLPYVKQNRAPAWRSWPGEEAYYHVEVAPGAEGAAAIALDPDRGESKRLWSEQRGFFRYLALPALKAGTRALLVERESRSPVLVERRFPSGGKVCFLAMNETWRWRFGGAEDQSRFWRTLLRGSMEAPYAAGDGVVALDAERIVVGPREKLALRAKIVAPIPASDAPVSLTALLVREENAVREVTMNRVGTLEPARYEASVTDLPAGDYVVRVDDEVVGEGGMGVTLAVSVREDGETEMANLSGDREKLRAMAEGSGGTMLTPEQFAALPGLIEEARGRQPRVVELPLWDSFYLYGFVVGCFAAEWAGRKRLGLA